MSQYAADAMPVILNNTFKEISLQFMPQIQQMQQEVMRLQQTVGKLNTVEGSKLSGGDQEKQDDSKSKMELQNLSNKIRFMQQQRDEKVDFCMKEAFDIVDTDMRLKFGQGPILPENIKKEKPFEMYENDLVHLSGCTGTMILV